ncbi:3527_t:CDS:10 [Paraglomus brasilianum]|uniref:Kinesin-like protein n=1 Tax=Paraglomus brasilianum TaxID=144538 RepID=A0A9N9BJ80_9GLOM|nr:3527_t:CDS:10 [Paraglomus brasilianum]
MSALKRTPTRARSPHIQQTPSPAPSPNYSYPTTPTSSTPPRAETPITPTTPGANRQNVQVTVRVRPPNDVELNRGETEVWEVNNDSGRICLDAAYAERNRRPRAEYYYDEVFVGSDNRALFQKGIQETVLATMEGYNGTESQPGVIPQAVDTVFQYISNCTEKSFLLRVAYMEIYNETVRDLLCPETGELRIHEDKKRGVYVTPLKEIVVSTPRQVLKAINRGEANRSTGSTDWNERSSRSHTIFQMIIESTDDIATTKSALQKRYSVGVPKLAGGSVTVSVLNLIDLAGSEKAASSADRRKEGSFINKSLLTLASVISKLTDNSGGHVPFRDSKLTRILQNSLSGNARVAVICTISPAALNSEESTNTLKFASRVKKVVTKAQTNQVMDDNALIKKYKAEIDELRAQLATTENKIKSSDDAESFERVGALRQAIVSERRKHEEEQKEWQLTQTALKERIDHLTKLILTNESFVQKKAIIEPKRQEEPLKQKIAILESELSQKNNLIKKLQSQVSSAHPSLVSTDVQKSRDEIKKFWHKMEDKLRNVLLLELNQSPSPKQNSDLRNSRAEYEKLSSEMENHVFTLVSRESNPLRATETELEMLRAENLRLSRQVKEQESAIVAFESERINASLKTTEQRTRDETRAEQSDLRRQIEIVKSEKEALRKKLQDQERLMTEYQEKIESLETETKQAKGHSRSGSNNGVQAEYSKTIQRQQQIIKTRDQEIRSKEATISELKEQIRRMGLNQFERSAPRSYIKEVVLEPNPNPIEWLKTGNETATVFKDESKGNCAVIIYWVWWIMPFVVFLMCVLSFFVSISMSSTMNDNIWANSWLSLALDCLPV